MKYEIEKTMRDQIIQTLQLQLVPAISAGVLLQIANILTNLKEIETQKVPDVPKQENV